MRKAVLAGLLYSTLAISAYAQGVSVPPSVDSVNEQKGKVSVPTVERKFSSPLDASRGVVTWTFPTPFVGSPTCFVTIKSANDAFSFDAPLVTAIDLNSVTVKLTAHPATLSVVGVNLPVSVPLTTLPPPGTVITLSCIGGVQ